VEIHGQNEHIASAHAEQFRLLDADPRAAVWRSCRQPCTVARDRGGWRTRPGVALAAGDPDSLGYRPTDAVALAPDAFGNWKLNTASSPRQRDASPRIAGTSGRRSAWPDDSAVNRPKPMAGWTGTSYCRQDTEEAGINCEVARVSSAKRPVTD
jgi:hypothetical protein